MSFRARLRTLNRLAAEVLVECGRPFRIIPIVIHNREQIKELERLGPIDLEELGVPEDTVTLDFSDVIKLLDAKDRNQRKRSRFEGCQLRPMEFCQLSGAGIPQVSPLC